MVPADVPLPPHVLFDLDGTLTDPAVGICRSLRFALERLQLPVPPNDSLHRCIGPPLQRGFVELLGVPPNQVEQAVAFYRERYRSEGQFENEPYAGISELLGELQRAGSTLWVATSKPTVFATNIVKHFGLESFFERVYGSELDGTNSDKADLIRHLMTLERIGAPAAVMIGDREHDVIGAVRNGIRAIGVTWGYGTAEELAAAGAHEVVSSPPTLRQALERMVL